MFNVLLFSVWAASFHGALMKDQLPGVQCVLNQVDTIVDWIGRLGDQRALQERREEVVQSFGNFLDDIPVDAMFPVCDSLEELYFELMEPTESDSFDRSLTVLASRIMDLVGWNMVGKFFHNVYGRVLNYLAQLEYRSDSLYRILGKKFSVSELEIIGDSLDIMQAKWDEYQLSNPDVIFVTYPQLEGFLDILTDESFTKTSVMGYLQVIMANLDLSPTDIELSDYFSKRPEQDNHLNRNTVINFYLLRIAKTGKGFKEFNLSLEFVKKYMALSPRYVPERLSSLVDYWKFCALFNSKCSEIESSIEIIIDRSLSSYRWVPRINALPSIEFPGSHSVMWFRIRNALLSNRIYDFSPQLSLSPAGPFITAFRENMDSPFQLWKLYMWIKQSWRKEIFIQSMGLDEEWNWAYVHFKRRFSINVFDYLNGPEYRKNFIDVMTVEIPMNFLRAVQFSTWDSDEDDPTETYYLELIRLFELYKQEKERWLLTHSPTQSRFILDSVYKELLRHSFQGISIIRKIVSRYRDLTENLMSVIDCVFGHDIGQTISELLPLQLFGDIEVKTRLLHNELFNHQKQISAQYGGPGSFTGYIFELLYTLTIANHLGKDLISRERTAIVHECDDIIQAIIRSGNINRFHPMALSEIARELKIELIGALISGSTNRQKLLRLRDQLRRIK